MRKFKVVVGVERVYFVEAEDEQEALKKYQYADFDETEVEIVDVEEGD